MWGFDVLSGVILVGTGIIAAENISEIIWKNAAELNTISLYVLYKYFPALILASGKIIKCSVTAELGLPYLFNINLYFTSRQRKLY